MSDTFGGTTDVLTKAEAAEILGVSERQIQRYISDRKIRASRLSHKVVRIRREEIERFMKRSTA